MTSRKDGSDGFSKFLDLFDGNKHGHRQKKRKLLVVAAVASLEKPVPHGTYHVHERLNWEAHLKELEQED